MNNSPEKIIPSTEIERSKHEALEKIGNERRQQLHEKLEQNKAERSKDNLETLHQTAIEQAETVAPDEERTSSPAERRGPISLKERDASFTATLKEARTHMPAPSRAFSTVIHNKAIEKVSEGVGNTIARPNAILTGAIFAFIATLGLYLIAKNMGYQLSGFETIGAFIVGWILGIIFDFLKVMITGQK